MSKLKKRPARLTTSRGANRSFSAIHHLKDHAVHTQCHELGPFYLNLYVNQPPSTFFLSPDLPTPHPAAGVSSHLHSLGWQYINVCFCFGVFSLSRSLKILSRSNIYFPKQIAKMEEREGHLLLLFAWHGAAVKIFNEPKITHVRYCHLWLAI